MFVVRLFVRRKFVRPFTNSQLQPGLLSSLQAGMKGDDDAWFKNRDALSFLAVVDPLDWRNCAAAGARWMEGGMGSGVVLPRVVAGRLGQAQLENKTRFALAKSGRTFGCVVDANLSMGGRYVSRPALWRASVA